MDKRKFDPHKLGMWCSQLTGAVQTLFSLLLHDSISQRRLLDIAEQLEYVVKSIRNYAEEMKSDG